MAKQPNQPDLTVDYQEKFRLVAMMIGPLAASLAEASRENALTADDLIDTLTMALGVVLSNDTNLTTPRDFRLAAEVIAKYVERHTKMFREAEELAGSRSTFSRLIDAYQANPDTPPEIDFPKPH